MDATNQLTFIFLVIGWLVIWLVLSGLAILIRRAIQLKRISPVGAGVWLWSKTLKGG